MGFISQQHEEPFLFSIAFGTAVGPTQPRMDTGGFLSKMGDSVKVAAVCRCLPSSIYCRRKQCEDFNLHSPTRLTHVMFI
jgi:hypothetical protein